MDTSAKHFVTTKSQFNLLSRGHPVEKRLALTFFTSSPGSASAVSICIVFETSSSFFSGGFDLGALYRFALDANNIRDNVAEEIRLQQDDFGLRDKYSTSPRLRLGLPYDQECTSQQSDKTLPEAAVTHASKVWETRTIPQLIL